MRWGDETLSSRLAIDKLFKEGKAYRGRHILLILRRADEGPRKVLFVASRRVGNAVSRSRAKRLMREAYREQVARMSPVPMHLAWVARASCSQRRMNDILDDMAAILAAARLIQGGTTDDRADA